MINANAVYFGYVGCALWSSLDDYGASLDSKKYYGYAWDEDGEKKMQSDCEKFVQLAEKELELADVEDDELIGHDFWLTRNGHGAGFWDSPEKWGGQENADKLSEIARSFGECNIDADDEDETFYVQGG